MKKTKVEPLEESLTLRSENSLKRFSQKAWKLTIMADSTLWGTDKWFSAQRWLLIYSKLFVMYNLVSPMHSYNGRNSAREDDSAVGKGFGKKQKSVRNKLNRGISST